MDYTVHGVTKSQTRQRLFFFFFFFFYIITLEPKIRDQEDGFLNARHSELAGCGLPVLFSVNLLNIY